QPPQASVHLRNNAREQLLEGLVVVRLDAQHELLVAAAPLADLHRGGTGRRAKCCYWPCVSFPSALTSAVELGRGAVGPWVACLQGVRWARPAAVSGTSAVRSSYFHSSVLSGAAANLL